MYASDINAADACAAAIIINYFIYKFSRYSSSCFPRLHLTRAEASSGQAGRSITLSTWLAFSSLTHFLMHGRKALVAQ